MQRIHIIILNYKTYQDTITVVENLLQQESVELKIVVVDNCSPNESYNVLSKRFNSYEQVEVILSPENGGYGSGNNIGLLHIKNDSPEYVGVLNNDIQLEDSQLLYKLINTLEKDDEAYFCSPMMVVDGIKRKTAFRYPRIGFSLLTTPKLGDIFFSKCKYYPIKEGKIQKVECLPGSFFISGYNKFEQLGFFDDRTFLFEEEAILAYKIKQQKGYNIICNNLEYHHAVSKVIDGVYSRINKLKIKHQSLYIYYKYHVKSTAVVLLLLRIFQQIRIIQERVIFLFKK